MEYIWEREQSKHLILHSLKTASTQLARVFLVITDILQDKWVFHVSLRKSQFHVRGHVLFSEVLALSPFRKRATLGCGKCNRLSKHGYKHHSLFQEPHK